MQTTCAFEAAKKPHLYKQPLEVKLLMCMLYKASVEEVHVSSMVA